jgi:heme exporter protein C
LCMTLNFVVSVRYLWKQSWGADALAEASAEVAVVFGGIGVLLGAIWGRPTWGVYWTWDPRLTTAAIMLVTYAGYLALRKFVDDPEKRAARSAVVGIIAFVNVPLVWYSVKWFNSLHQVQSSPKTVDPQMTFSLRFNAFAFLAVMIAFVYHRTKIASRMRQAELAPPDAIAPSVGRAA